VSRPRRRRCWALVVALAAVLLVACGGGSAGSSAGSSSSPPARQDKVLDVKGVQRAYRVFAPPSLDRRLPPPLIIVLGGVGNSAESMVEATQFDRQAIDGGFVVAYADGIGQTWNAGYCCGTAARDDVDDVSFLVAVMDQVHDEYGTDPARVFPVGVSNGAMMAYRLACERADRVAGVGSVAGAMILDDCHPSRPVKVIEIHGTADDLVPYGGGRTAGGATQPSPPTPAVAERWATLDGCPDEAVTAERPVVTTANWTNCAGGTAVRLVTVDGGGHTWYAPKLGPADGALDATAEIWTFLSGGG
jgi:polyhydroxybutyrate depolymerase